MRILLHSDQPILAVGLECLLSATAGLEMAGTCFGIAQAEAQIATLDPDILLLDLSPEVNFEVLRELRNIRSECPVVLWVDEISTELAFQALGMGVRGILRKNLSPEGIVECLRKVHAGELWYEKDLTDRFFAARRVVLTPREGQLVSLISRGLKNKEIATALEIAEGTVKVYLGRLFQKLGVKDRFELALFGLKNLSSGRGRSVEGCAAGQATDAQGLRSLLIPREPRGPAGGAARAQSWRSLSGSRGLPANEV